MNTRRMVIVLLVVFVALMVVVVLAVTGAAKPAQPLVTDKEWNISKPTPAATIDFSDIPPTPDSCNVTVVPPVSIGHWKGGTFVPLPSPSWPALLYPAWCPTPTPTKPPL